MTSNIKAILLMLGCMALFTTLDASAKLVTQSLPIPVAVFARYAIALLLTSALMALKGGDYLKTRHPVLQLLRGGFLLASTFANFFAMGYLQLAQTGAIFFTIPLLVCALSGPLLSEKVGLHRWLAVLAGFIGVLIIMQPGTTQFHPAMLVSLIAALMGALYNIVTRKVGGKDAAETSLFYVCLVGALIAGGPMLTHFQMPQGWQWYPLLFMGLAGAIGHWMLIQAHRLAPASTIAPFIFSQIIWMIIAGYSVFGQLPNLWTVIGATIVIASSLYVFHRERQKGVDTVSTTTPAD